MGVPAADIYNAYVGRPDAAPWFIDTIDMLKDTFYGKDLPEKGDWILIGGQPWEVCGPPDPINERQQLRSLDSGGGSHRRKSQHFLLQRRYKKSPTRGATSWQALDADLRNARLGDGAALLRRLANQGDCRCCLDMKGMPFEQDVYKHLSNATNIGFAPLTLTGVWLIVNSPHAQRFQIAMGERGTPEILYHMTDQTDPTVVVLSDHMLDTKKSFFGNAFYGRGIYLAKHALYSYHIFVCPDSTLQEDKGTSCTPAALPSPSLHTFCVHNRVPTFGFAGNEEHKYMLLCYALLGRSKDYGPARAPTKCCACETCCGRETCGDGNIPLEEPPPGYGCITGTENDLQRSSAQRHCGAGDDLVKDVVDSTKSKRFKDDAQFMQQNGHDIGRQYVVHREERVYPFAIVRVQRL